MVLQRTSAAATSATTTGVRAPLITLCRLLPPPGPEFEPRAPSHRALGAQPRRLGRPREVDAVGGERVLVAQPQRLRSGSVLHQL